MQGFDLQNLPPESQTWRRQVEDRIISLEDQLSDLAFTRANDSKSINATLDRMTGVVGSLRTQQEVLQEVNQLISVDFTFTDNTSGFFPTSIITIPRPSWASTVSTSGVSFETQQVSPSGMYAEGYIANGDGLVHDGWNWFTRITPGESEQIKTYPKAIRVEDDYISIGFAKSGVSMPAHLNHYQVSIFLTWA